MKIIHLIIPATLLFAACNNNKAGNTAKTFCDTTCTSDSLKFKENAKFNPTVTLGIKNCEPDTLTWTHDRLLNSRQVQLSSFLGQPVRINKSAVSVAFKDTSYAWMAFNDCTTGRGYLLKLPFSKASGGIQKITGALNSFDPKFNIDPDLRAYTDRGSIYVTDVKTGKEEQMTFKEEYPIDFDNIHKVVDSINVTKTRIYVKLLKDGKELPFEKNISL
jgi:hypothetical protein